MTTPYIQQPLLEDGPDDISEWAPRTEFLKYGADSLASKTDRMDTCSDSSGRNTPTSAPSGVFSRYTESTDLTDQDSERAAPRSTAYVCCVYSNAPQINSLFNRSALRFQTNSSRPGSIQGDVEASNEIPNSNAKAWGPRGGTCDSYMLLDGPQNITKPELKQEKVDSNMEKDDVDSADFSDESDLSSGEESDGEGDTSDEEDSVDDSEIVECLAKGDYMTAFTLSNRRIVQRAINNSLHYVLPTAPSSIKSCTGTESSRGTHQSEGNARIAGKSRSEGTGRSGRRATEGDGETPQGDDDDEDEGERRRKGKAKAIPDSKEPRYACPYFKKDPGRYKSVRGCPGPGWDSVHRVKEHIYRRHARPIQCVRCWETFDNGEEYLTHQRATTICEVKPEAKADGIDKDQERRLKSKKRAAHVNTEIDKWVQVYRILFPDDEEIPTPFYVTVSEFGRNSPDSHWFADFEEFHRFELPRLIQQRAEAFQESAEEKLKTQLFAVMDDCIAESVRNFQQKRRSVASAPAGLQDRSTTDAAGPSGTPTSRQAERSQLEEQLPPMFEVPPAIEYAPAARFPPGYHPGMDQLRLLGSNSSQNSASNRFTMLSSNVPIQATEASLTSFSGSFPSQANHSRSRRRPPRNQAPSSVQQRIESNPQYLNEVTAMQQIARNTSAHETGAKQSQDEQPTSPMDFHFNNVSQGHQSPPESFLTSTNGMLQYSPPFQFSSPLYMENQSPDLSSLPQAGPGEWVPQSEPVSASQFEQRVMIPPMNPLSYSNELAFDWSQGLTGVDSQNVPGYDNNIGESQPKKRRR